MKKIPFSPPDITQAEIDEVTDTLRSGWITTGPKTNKFETEIAKYCGAEKCIALSSATAGLELTLRLLGIGKGDEVITTPLTFAATANVILHTGAKPVFADVEKEGFNIDAAAVEKALTRRTKAVIPVDYGGYPCDYDALKDVLNMNKKKFHPDKRTFQRCFDRPVLIADAAHSLGAVYRGKRTGTLADFNVFSFHAVKNLTTAEGGAVLFNSVPGLDSSGFYEQMQLLSLHGQNKNALEKMRSGGWKYSIELPGYKYNMTDVHASIGLAQLRRYDTEIIPRRKKHYELYKKELQEDSRFILPPFNGPEKASSWHLFPVRLKGADEKVRDAVIAEMTKKDIAVNVHFIPVVMHRAYRELGYDIRKYPNTYGQYCNEISLPLYPALTDEDVLFVCRELKNSF